MDGYHFPDVTDRLEIDPSAFVHPRAYLVGTVRLGAEASVWSMAVVRGDEGVIRIGARSNIQDGCVLHADPDAFLTIGDDVTVGHGAILHGCTIGDGALIGIGATVLNWAEVGAGAVIAARALVTERRVVPPGMLLMGMPGSHKLVPLRPEQADRLRQSAQHYVTLARLYRERAETEAQTKA